MSIPAKEKVSGWTTPTGALSTRGNEDPTEVYYDRGEEVVMLRGRFDADTLTEIAAHMRSTQK